MGISLRAVAARPAGRTPTDEQAAAIDVFKTGDALVLEAGAGTGKTTTLKMMAEAKPMHTGVYVAYNRAIAEDARASFPDNTRCATAHSFAFREVGRLFKHRLNGPRQTGRQSARLLGVDDALQIADKRWLRKAEVARLALDTVAAFCNSADALPGPGHIPFVNGIEDWAGVREAIVPLARKAWEDLSDPHGELRFTHDVYLKLWALGRPTLPCDFLLLDEAQDANPVIADVVLRQDAQLIAVGDQSQAIYGWRGAVDAMETWPAEHRLPLAQSFRFGPAIAEEANGWLSRLEAPLRLRGLESIASELVDLPRPRAVLCRTNMETVAVALRAMEDGRSPAIVGGTGEIRRLAEAAGDLKAGVGTDHRDLCAFGTWAEVQDYVQEDQSAADLRVLVGLVDRYGVDTMLRVANRAVEERDADLIVSTAHKAKGREWSSVRIADDFNAPAPGEDVDRSELMLTYVAVTRAKLRLDCAALQLPTGGPTRA